MDSDRAESASAAGCPGDREPAHGRRDHFGRVELPAVSLKPAACGGLRTTEFQGKSISGASRRGGRLAIGRQIQCGARCVDSEWSLSAAVLCRFRPPLVAGEKPVSALYPGEPASCRHGEFFPPAPVWRALVACPSAPVGALTRVARGVAHSMPLPRLVTARGIILRDRVAPSRGDSARSRSAAVLYRFRPPLMVGEKPVAALQSVAPGSCRQGGFHPTAPAARAPVVGVPARVGERT